MRLDRLGRPLAHDIRVRRGYCPHSIWLPHEVLWIEAAMTLPFQAKHFAYRDIASLTGKSLDQVANKARLIKLAERASEAFRVAAE